VINPISIEKQRQERPNENIFDNLVIKLDSTWKGIFDIILLFASVMNTFSQAYYAAFGLPTSELEIFLDQSIEFLFWLDFFFCFCQEYIDEQTFMAVSELKLIAKHYMMGSCFFDLLACIPFAYIINGV